MTKFIPRKCMILFILCCSMQLLSYADTPDGKQPDTAAIISKYREDSVHDRVRIDSLLKALKADQDNAKTYKYVFIGGSITIFLISIILCWFLFYVARKSPSNKKYALGLPDGSIRAIIAILAIVFYVSSSLALSLLDTKSTIPADVTKTLGTLVVAISAFYFGSKTAEQGGKTATENLTTLLNNTNNDNKPDPVPVAIIQQAIKDNKANWMTLYHCIDITAGKKKLQGTIQDIDCIVFKVIEKTDNPAASAPAGTAVQTIPPIITYSSLGKEYKIPTDVLENQP